MKKQYVLATMKKFPSRGGEILLTKYWVKDFQFGFTTFTSRLNEALRYNGKKHAMEASIVNKLNVWVEEV